MRALFLFFILFVPVATHAATLYFSPSNIELYRGDIAKVAVRLDVADDECVNTVDGVITYEAGIEPVDISRGSSIFTMWVEEPTINRNNRTITFAGGIPNGYCGRIAGDPRVTNNIIDIIFSSPSFVIGSGGSSQTSSTVQLAFAPETQVLLNDGTGEAAELAAYETSIVLQPKASSTLQNEWQAAVLEDEIPPNPFSITLEQTENAFSNRYFITFNTSDKQTGIDHYEIIEEPLDQLDLFTWGAQNAPWVEARSPYVLKDQSLNSTIRVRAIDKAGNEYVATLIPDESLRHITPSMYLMIGLLALVVVVFFGALGWFLWRQRRRETREVGYDVTDDEVDYGAADEGSEANSENEELDDGAAETDGDYKK